MQLKTWAEKINNNLNKVIYDKEKSIEKLLVSLLCRGHALIEDVPGVGKTVIARALAKSLGGMFQRVQCTPDLLPADILGVSIYNEKTMGFDFQDGPIMTNILLVDEINRATPRTQSALLEAMEARKISVEGKARELPEPFFLLATENPIEFEGTFPLPEAQRDRFLLTLSMGYPSKEAELKIMQSHRRVNHPLTDLIEVSNLNTVIDMQNKSAEIKISTITEDFILNIIDLTRKDPRLTVGASPRASIAIYKGSQALAGIRGKSIATIPEVIEITPAILHSRLVIKPEYVHRNINSETIIKDILEKAKNIFNEDHKM